MQKLFYRKKSFRLLHGNSLKILKTLPSSSVDVIFVDPPYRLSSKNFLNFCRIPINFQKGAWDKTQGIEKDFNFHLKWIQECKRILKPNGTLWVTGTYHSIYSCGFALQKEKFSIINDIIWYKPNAYPNVSHKQFTASHEILLWAKKDKNSKHYFNYQAMKDGEWADFLKKDGRQMRSVWAISGTNKAERKFGKHPTQKPEELLKRIILASTQEGDTILDPFCGSSTTGIVANRFGRKYIGIDQSKKYLDLSIRRFEATKTEPDTAEAQKFSFPIPIFNFPIIFKKYIT